MDVVARDAAGVGGRAPGQRDLSDVPDVAIRSRGAVGGVVSAVAVALASFDAGPTLPAASSAVTL